jgi:DNA polymerase
MSVRLVLLEDNSSLSIFKLPLKGTKELFKPCPIRGSMGLKELEEDASRCTKCPLHTSRRQVVFGTGNSKARVMLIGEAPGYWEDLRGEPFVGAAGKILNTLLELAGLSRDEVYITNVVKCRPPGNREPNEEEIRACSYYLDAQLEIISPEITVMLGNHASAAVLGKHGVQFSSMFRSHGKVMEIDGKLFVPMFHPAVALYQPNVKAMVEEDWRRLGGIIKSKTEADREA